MDLGEMIRQTVDLDDDARAALAQACQIKANALQEIRARLARMFDARTRVIAADVLNAIDTAVAEYEAGSTPDYWSKPTV